MTQEELASLTNIELFITSDLKAFVFTIETFDEEIEDISIKYYKISRNPQGIPVIEKINNTIELLIAPQEAKPNTSPQGLKLIKLDKKDFKDEEQRNEFIRLITAIETAQVPAKRTNTKKSYYTPIQGPELKLLRTK